MKFSFLVRKQDNKSREQFMTAASMIRSLIDATLNMQFPYFKILLFCIQPKSITFHKLFHIFLLLKY